MFTVKSNLILASVISALIADAAFADETARVKPVANNPSLATAKNKNPKLLDVVVVSANRGKASLKSTPQRIEVISKEDIERTPASELTDVLKKNASVDVIQYPGNLSGVGIRGFRPEFSGINKHSLLLIDGRPAMGTNLSLMNIDRIERIEVLKGPASALYGSSAMGGVINLISKESRGPIHGFAQVDLGSYDTQQLKGAVGGAINKIVDFDYSGSYFNQDKDVTLGDGNTRPHTAYGQQNHALRIGVNFSPDWRLSLNTDLYCGRDIASPGNIAAGTTGQTNKDMDRHGTDLKLVGNVGDHQVLARVFEGEQAYEQFIKTSTSAAAQAYLPYRSFAEELSYRGWQLQDSWAWGVYSSLVFGVDQDTAEQVTRSYNANGTNAAPFTANNQRDSLGFYAQNTWNLNSGNSTVYLGVRRDELTATTYLTPYKTGFVPSSADFSNTSPSAGFKHLLGHGFRLHGTAGKGFVSPDASQLTGSATAVSGKITTITEGNPNLTPESSVTYDLGVEWSNESIFTDLTYFSTKVTDKIVNPITTISKQPSGTQTNLSTFANGAGAEMRGLEWSGRWQFNAQLRASVSATHYFEAEEEKVTNGGAEWVQVRNVPDNTIRAGLDLTQGAWSGRVGVRYVGNLVDNNWQGDTSQYIRYSPFSLADLSARYRFDKRQSLSLNVDNLFDRYYVEKGGFPMPGRNFRLAYRYDF